MIIVAYLSLFDGEIKQAAYYDCSPLEAMNSFLGGDFETEDEIYPYCADCDSFISYIEI